MKNVQINKNIFMYTGALKSQKSVCFFHYVGITDQEILEI